MGKPRWVLVTGLSGSGKSTVAKSFEDLGYYCVDNLPLPLLRGFLEDPASLVRGYDRFAVVTDVRAPGFATELPALLAEIDRGSTDLTLLFLEANDEILVRRFSETRRPHPLSSGGQVIEGIRDERLRLAEIRGAADLVFDTSEWSIHGLRDRVFRVFSGESAGGPDLVVPIVSFGFKHGIPYGTDLLFDVRFLPNPHFIPELRPQTGCDDAVREYLEAQPEFLEMVARLADLMLWLLPRYHREHRRYASIAIGCTGGHHRSVGAAERLKTLLEKEDWAVRLVHRDIDR